MVNETERRATEAEAHEWLASVTELVAGSGPLAIEARPAALAQIVDSGRRVVERCSTVRNPDLIADLYLTVATAEVELAGDEQSDRRDALLRDAINHCDLAVAAAMGSHTTFVPAEVLPWAMGTLSFARTTKPGGQERMLDARVSSYMRDFGQTLERMEQDRQRGAEALSESVVLFAASGEVSDASELRLVVSSAIEQARKAKRLLASTGDFEMVRFADEHIASMQHTLRSAPAREVAVPPRSSGGAAQSASLRCATCGAPLAAGTRFCAACGSPVLGGAPATVAGGAAKRPRPAAPQLSAGALISVLGLIVAGASVYLPWAKVGALTVTPLTPGARFQFGQLLDSGGLDARLLLGGALLAGFLTVYGARGGILSGGARRLAGTLSGLLIPFTIAEVLFILARSGASLGVGIYALIAGTAAIVLATTLGGRRGR